MKKRFAYMLALVGAVVGGVWIGSIPTNEGEPTAEYTNILPTEVAVGEVSETAIEQPPKVFPVQPGWDIHTAPDETIMFQLPAGYLAGFERGIISEPTGGDQYFPLTKMSVQEADTPLAAYHASNDNFHIDYDITVIPHTIYDGVTVLRIVIPPHPPIRESSYIHSVYIASNEASTRHYVFTGWEDFSLADWEHIGSFLASIYVN